MVPQQVSFVERSSLSQRVPYRRFHCIHLSYNGSFLYCIYTPWTGFIVLDHKLIKDVTLLGTPSKSFGSETIVYTMAETMVLKFDDLIRM